MPDNDDPLTKLTAAVAAAAQGCGLSRLDYVRNALLQRLALDGLPQDAKAVWLATHPEHANAPRRQCRAQPAASGEGR
jgi:hypothetical protein